MSGGNFMNKFLVKTNVALLNKDTKDMLPQYQAPQFVITDENKQNAKQALAEYRYLNKVFS